MLTRNGERPSRIQVIHYHTDNPDVEPDVSSTNPDSLQEGEIAICTAAGNEKIFIKNHLGGVATFNKLTRITESEIDKIIEDNNKRN